MSSEDHIPELRARIDAIDEELVRLVSERARIAQEVGQVKRQGGAETSFYRPEREAQILRRVRAMNPGPLSSDDLGRLWREMMSMCLAMERVLRVAYLGPEGTYTHAAAQKHFGSAVTMVPVSSIEEVVREVGAASSDYGVVPVENSLEGPINQTLDCLRESAVKICGEVILGVHHQLLSQATGKTQITRVYGHEQALGQCRRWLDTHLPAVERVALSSNAVAAQRAAADPAAAAVAGEHAAVLYAIPVLFRNIEDHPQNSTRFVVLGNTAPEASGHDLTSLMFSTPNRPGALYAVLQAFAEGNLSMTRIESRPMRQGTWDYLFFVDIEGHVSDPGVIQALDKIAGRTSLLKVLGSYPRAVL